MRTVCNFCGNGSFKETKLQYVYRHDNLMLVVNDVPCEQCTFCGEQYYAAAVLAKIEDDFNQYHHLGKRPAQEMRVPVEQFVI